MKAAPRLECTARKRPSPEPAVRHQPYRTTRLRALPAGSMSLARQAHSNIPAPAAAAALLDPAISTCAAPLRPLRHHMPPPPPAFASAAPAADAPFEPPLPPEQSKRRSARSLTVSAKPLRPFRVWHAFLVCAPLLLLFCTRRGLSAPPRLWGVQGPAAGVPRPPALRSQSASTAASETTSEKTASTSASSTSTSTFTSAAAADAAPRRIVRERMLAITEGNKELVYFPQPDVLLMTQAKGGTTALLHWMYRGLTGLARYNRTLCEGRAVQNLASVCWAGVAYPLHALPEARRLEVLEGTSTLRVAVQREPYSRLISCFKSKFACADAGFGSDRTRATTVYFLMKRAYPSNFSDTPANPSHTSTCLSVLQFAQALHAAAHIARPRDPALRSLDVHYRPQRFFHNDIAYHLVLDLADVSNASAIAPLWRRLPFRDAVGPVVKTVHTSTDAPLHVPAEAERLLRAFASESRVVPLRYMPAAKVGRNGGAT